MPSDTTHKRTRSLSPIPAYQRIEEDIQRKVQDGRLPAGAMLASRHNLAKEYGVALSTVQQAVANLITEGVLETSDRRGTFVASTLPFRQNGATASADGSSDITNGRAVVTAFPYASVPLGAERFVGT